MTKEHKINHTIYRWKHDAGTQHR